MVVATQQLILEYIISRQFSEGFSMHLSRSRAAKSALRLSLVAVLAASASFVGATSASATTMNTFSCTKAAPDEPEFCLGVNHNGGTIVNIQLQVDLTVAAATVFYNYAGPYNLDGSKTLNAGHTGWAPRWTDTSHNGFYAPGWYCGSADDSNGEASADACVDVS
jgi:hypothetical protein